MSMRFRSAITWCFRSIPAGAVRAAPTTARPTARSFVPLNLVGGAPNERSIFDQEGQPVGGKWFGQSSFASHAIANTRNAVVVDPTLPLELLGPLGCGLLTGAGSILRAMRVTPESDVVIFGAGAVGLAAVMAAQVASAGRIIAVDLSDDRLRLAAELGATHVQRGDAGRLASTIRHHLGGGAQFVLDTTGVPSIIDVALELTTLGGICGLVGAQQGTLHLDGAALFGRTVIGIIEGSADPHELIPVLVELWKQGQFPFDRLITKFALSEIATAEEASSAGLVVKPVLVPDPV